MKLPKFDGGSYCMHCGRYTEIHYIQPIVYHWKKKRYLQMWCVECIAAAKGGIEKANMGLKL